MDIYEDILDNVRHHYAICDCINDLAIFTTWRAPGTTVGGCYGIWDLGFEGLKNLGFGI